MKASSPSRAGFFVGVVLAACVRLAGAAEWHVGAAFAEKSLAEALKTAAAGDTVFLHGGNYKATNLTVSRPVQIVGVDRPTLDAGGEGGALLITSSNVTVRGLRVAHTGRSSIDDRAGIRVENASNVTVEDNELTGCHFGIYLGKAKNCHVLHNRVTGVTDIEQNCGNGIHLWNCESIHVEGNAISGHRDGIYLEFASQSNVVANEVVGNVRYGLHFMYSHDSHYRRNHFSKNGAGVAVMYSRHVDMTENTFDFNWGSSSYGLLLKDIGDSSISGNLFDRNSTAIYAQGASRMIFEKNRFTNNGWALRILASGENNTIVDNDFAGNAFDVATNGALNDHRFSGNYWDRYEGYDLNRDGVGDVPFRPTSLYASLVEQVPASVLLLRSSMVHLLDRAEKALPTLTSSVVADASPQLRPHRPDRPSTDTIASTQTPNTMKTSNLVYTMLLSLAVGLITACNEAPTPKTGTSPTPAPAAPGGGQSSVVDNTSEKDVVKVAIGSADHTTLVKAVQAAELVDVLSNAGPFTVFAPTNAAFGKLPPEALADLLKPENKSKLQDILQYHVAVGGYRAEMLHDGQTLNMANGGNVKLSVKDGKIVLNGTATVVGTVKASNGIVHVIDGVIAPPKP